MKKLVWVFAICLTGISCSQHESENSKEKLSAEVKTEETVTEDSKKVELEEKNQGELVGPEIWDDLLKEHVNKKGEVDYAGMKKDVKKLDEYLASVSANPPARNWSKDEKLAYWINAYNAFTVKLILNNADNGIASIKDIGPKTQVPFVNTPWDIKFIEIDGKKYDLNNIEHGIIRKEYKNDPRYHFALVCAAESCPRLRNEAYTAKKLNKQLEEEAEVFLNNREKNKIGKDGVAISPLFKWYSNDFEREMSIAEWINKYSDDKVDPEKKDFNYTDYSWKLNGKF